VNAVSVSQMKLFTYVECNLDFSFFNKGQFYIAT